MASVALAFGSFGDIATLVKIIVDFAKALRDRKASTEYQELIMELEALQAILGDIEDAFVAADQGTTTIPRSSLNAIELAVKKCHSLIKGFADRTQGYERSLLAGEPGTNLWDFWRTVDWKLFKKRAVADLKEQLRDQKTVMILMLSLSSSISLQRVEQHLKHLSAVKESPASPEHKIETSDRAPQPEARSELSGQTSIVTPVESSPPPTSLFSPPLPSQIDHGFNNQTPALPTYENLINGNSPFRSGNSNEQQAPVSSAHSNFPIATSPSHPNPVKPAWRNVQRRNKRPPRINTSSINSQSWAP